MPPPRDLTDAAFQRASSDEALRRTIRLGQGMMPAFGGMLPEQDIADVLAFIRSLSSAAPAEGRP